MSRRITKKKKSRLLEVPEMKERAEIIKKMQPLIKELGKLTRSERQIEIDNEIMRTTGKIITAVKNNDLLIDTSNFNISPLWSKATVLSNRMCEGTLQYTETSTKEYIIDVTARIIIKEHKVRFETNIDCKVPFDTAMSPNTQALLLLNDKISEEYFTNVEVFSADKCEILKLHIGNEKIEIQRHGGNVVLSFVMERSSEDDMSELISNLRKISQKIASANIFKKGVITVREVDHQKKLIGKPKEITESQLLDFVLEDDTE